MPTQLETILLCHFALELFDAWIADFYDFAAVKADKVIVVAIRLGDFVARNAVAEVDFHGKASIAEQLECTVYRGLTDAGITRDHMLVKFFKRVVAWQFKECLGYDASLRCGVQAFTAHEVQKIRQADVLLLCCHISAHPYTKCAFKAA